MFDEADSIVLGTITADINRGGHPAGSDRGVESAAGNLVADAGLGDLLQRAQFAFMNPGAVLSDLTSADSSGEGDGGSEPCVSTVRACTPGTSAYAHHVHLRMTVRAMSLGAVAGAVGGVFMRLRLSATGTPFLQQVSLCLA